MSHYLKEAQWVEEKMPYIDIKVAGTLVWIKKMQLPWTLQNHLKHMLRNRYRQHTLLLPKFRVTRGQKMVR